MASVYPVTVLFEQIASFDNLWLAARRAARGKRYRRPAAGFMFNLESEVLALTGELQAGTWTPGGYRTFRIFEPKERLICAAPFRDRVVHQALVQVVEPLFERAFISDTYACRKGRGTHRAIERVAGWARHLPWCLRVDVRKFFPSVDHEVARRLLEQRIRCERTLAVFERILGSWASDDSPLRWFAGDGLFDPVVRPRGIPIGNLTSQMLANVVLDPVDHCVKDGLGVRAYARYCDDIVVFSRDADDLRRVRDEIVAALARLRLTPHAGKTHIFPTAQGVPWLGFVVLPNRVRIRDEGVARARRRFRAFRHAVRRGARSGAEVDTSVRAWQAHAAHADAARIIAGMAAMATGVAR